METCEIVLLQFSKQGWHAWGFSFHQRIAGTLVGQEHAPTETSRPLSTGPDPCGRPCKDSGPPLSLGLEPHGGRPHTHPAFTVGGHHWHSVCDGLQVLCQYFRNVVIMRLRILATIAIDPLFESFSNFLWPSTVAPAREATSAQAASHHPTPLARTLQVHFLLALNRHTHPSRGHPFRPAPFWVHPKPKFDFSDFWTSLSINYVAE